MNRHDELLFELLEMGSDPYAKTRTFLKGLFATFDWTLAHDESGDYDNSRDGFLVFHNEKTGVYIRVDLEEDSYSGGYYSEHSFVTPQQKTITVWE